VTEYFISGIKPMMVAVEEFLLAQQIKVKHSNSFKILDRLQRIDVMVTFRYTLATFHPSDNHFNKKLSHTYDGKRRARVDALFFNISHNLGA
jgi:hypothetical protein